MKSLLVIAVLALAACSSTRQTALQSSGEYQAKAATPSGISFAKMTFVAEQKDYLPQLQGPWLIHTMQRQAQLPEETLNLALHLHDDKTFYAPTACGNIKGTYSVKGVSIRFGDVSYNNTVCENKEKMDEVVRLLTQSVSLYTVNGNMLFLKDNSGHNVFRVTR